MSRLESVTETEVQSYVELPLGQLEFGDLQADMSEVMEFKCIESLKSTEQEELRDPLMLLADVALAPPSDHQGTCSCDACLSLEVSVNSMQLQIFMSTADDLQDRLVNSPGLPERVAHAAEVPHFLDDCQPYFKHLESTARSTMFQPSPLPLDICSRLLDFSQQLCDRLEQLVLLYASYNLLSLDETEPNSVSHFCIGQCQLGPLWLSTFLYCRPTPYMAQHDTGLYKRMRWNVDRLGDQKQINEQGAKSEEGEAEKAGDTEYYFLCYEDIPRAHAEADGNSQAVSDCNVARMWSIGQWVQVKPDPNTEDIYDWILCEVPQGSYQRLLLLGSDEPSSRSATDSLQLLLSQYRAE